MSTRLEDLQNFLQENPTDPFLHYALTLEYVKLDQKEEALSGFENLVEHYPAYVGTYYHFGKYLEAQHQPERALAMYQQGMRIAQEQRNRHALSELEGAYNLAAGELDDEDDNY